MSIQRGQSPIHGDVNYFDASLPLPHSFWRLAESRQRVLMGVFIRKTCGLSLPFLTTQGDSRQGCLGKNVFPGCLPKEQDLLCKNQGLSDSHPFRSPSPCLMTSRKHLADKFMLTYLLSMDLMDFPVGRGMPSQNEALYRSAC